MDGAAHKPVAELGPLVSIAEMTAFASRKCSTCFGAGMRTRLHGKVKIADVCGCAVRRFLARHRSEVAFDQRDMLHWRTMPMPAKAKA